MPTEGSSKAWSSRRVGLVVLPSAMRMQFGWLVLAIIVSSQRGGQIERSAVVGGFAALALMKAAATTIVAAKTIEETAEAEPEPTLRGQLAVALPVVPPSSAACRSPRHTWDGCDRRHQPTPRRSPAASIATCSLLHLQAVIPFQLPLRWQIGDRGSPWRRFSSPSFAASQSPRLTKRRDFDGRRR